MDLARLANVARARRLGVLMLACVGAIHVHAAAGAQAQPRTSIETLDPAARFSAIIEMQQRLSPDLLGTADQRQALAELASWAEVPRSLFDRLLVLSTLAEESDRALVLRAMGGVRSRDAASFLLAKAGADPSERVRETAFAALATLSGRDDLGSDLAAWQAWATRGLTLSESEWRRRNQIGLAAQAKRLEAERRLAASRLVEAYRALWLAQAAERRDGFLAELLTDPMPELHRLGVELTRLELSSGRVLAEPVVEAAVGLLVDDRPSRRREAAGLVDLLAPEQGGAAVAAALAKERTPTVAASLLRASVRWPKAENEPAALAWFESGGPATPAASQALMAIHAKDVLSTDAAGRIVAVLRERPLDEVSGAGMRLLVALGTPEDHRRVARAMTSEQSAGRRAAAEALLPRAEFLDAVIDAALADAALFGPAIRAAMQHRPDSASFVALRGAVEAHETLRWESLVPLAERMPQAELLEVAWAVKEPARRERLFELALPEPDDELAGDVSDGVLAAVIELGRLRLDGGRPGEALEALDWLPAERRNGEATWVKLVSLVSLGRLAEAEAIDGPPGAWIEGLARSVDQPYAAAVQARIVERFADRLDEAAQQRLEAIQQRLAARESAQAEDGTD